MYRSIIGWALRRIGSSGHSRHVFNIINSGILSVYYIQCKELWGVVIIISLKMIRNPMFMYKKLNQFKIISSNVLKSFICFTPLPGSCRPFKTPLPNSSHWTKLCSTLLETFYTYIYIHVSFWGWILLCVFFIKNFIY